MGLRVPIFLDFTLVGFFGLVTVAGFDAAAQTFVSTFWSYSLSYDLMAIPLFILMGTFAFHSGIGADLYRAAESWLARIPGGLAIATTWGSAGFSAVTGSSAAGTATFAPIAYKPMKDANYDERLVLGVLTSAPSMGVLIPPSVAFIVYGSITGESIGKLFIAGIIPGLLQAAIYTITIVLLTGSDIWHGPAGASSTWKDKFISLKGIWGMLIIFFLVIGGLYGGFFTPTEGAAVGAVSSFIIFLIKKGFLLTTVKEALAESLRTSCMIYMLVISSLIFAQFIALTGLSTALVYWVMGLDISPIFIIGGMLIVYIILGFPMPATPMIVLTVPLMYPILTDVFHMSGIWFGVLTVVIVEIANITPPVGINLFVVQGLFKETRLKDLYWGVTPFIIADVIRTALLTAFPIFSLWLIGE
ncbi:MAG: TRAP transporter large permease [Deltaproteobacteria bacterium]|nr:TRAP transporter large permease [Deltaproteobacteria bacterium]